MCQHPAGSAAGGVPCEHGFLDSSIHRRFVRVTQDGKTKLKSNLKTFKRKRK